MRIIGIDPGLKTGLVSFSISEENLPVCVEAYELEFVGVGRYLEYLNLVSSKTIVICEAFIITPQTAKNSPAPWSLEVIGLARYICAKIGVPFFLQAPSSAKRLVSDGVLHRGGLYFKGKPHACDAARHALFYVLTELKLMQDILRRSGDSG